MNAFAWAVAVVAGLAPRRIWSSLEIHLPLRSAAVVSGLVTLVAGFVLGVRGFLAFGTQLASANNEWMLRRLAAAPVAGDSAVGMVPLGMSVFTLFIFVFFTSTGLISLYLVTTGTLRAFAAWIDDPIGDPLLTGIDWAATTLWRKNRGERRQIARTRLEGANAPDVMRTGEWAGRPDADYVVLAARKKDEWNAGAIIMTGEDWYKLGVPFDMETPMGLRTAYPLKKMETVEVVRRGVQYELPRLLPGRAASAAVDCPPSHSASPHPDDPPSARR